MSDITAHLLLPYILASQAQKHVTHNEAVRLLDAMVQLSVLDRDLTAPPASPADGDRYIVASGATGLWAGWDLNVAYWVDGIWMRLVPRPGWLAWVADEARTVIWSGAAWVGVLSAADLQNLPGVGINTTSDATNKLSVAAASTLLNNAGAGHQLKINKALATDTASLLYQTGFSGRAEMGLAGTNDFSVKVSADGAVWNTGLTLAAATGKVSMPLGAVVTGGITGTAITQTTTDATAGRLTKVGDFGLGGLAPLAGNIGVIDNSIVTGIYSYIPSSGSSGGPASAPNGSLIHIRRSAGGGEVQMMITELSGESAGTVLSRARITGAWSEWRRSYGDSNLLGTVSQSAGVPTGAVIERGSNANGSYTRFADGTQICWSLVASSAGAGAVWTFPAAFSAAPIVTGTATNVVLRAVMLDSAATATDCTLSARDTANARVSNYCNMTAVGRWF